MQTTTGDVGSIDRLFVTNPTHLSTPVRQSGLELGSRPFGPLGPNYANVATGPAPYRPPSERRGKMPPQIRSRPYLPPGRGTRWFAAAFASRPAFANSPDSALAARQSDG